MKDMRHLPRLPRPYYQAFAAVHWTVALQDRASGWLDDLFHSLFRELLLHTAAREGLFCPAYVLMPEHIHLLWLGLRPASDQINGMRFLRKYLQLEFNQGNSRGEPTYQLQKQSHDNVLREKDRTHGALASTCFYILENPVRAGLVPHSRDWRWSGAVLPGYPEMRPLSQDFWPLFWKLYMEHKEEVHPPTLPPAS